MSTPTWKKKDLFLPKREIPKTDPIAHFPLDHLQWSNELDSPHITAIPPVTFLDTQDEPISQYEFEQWFGGPLTVHRAVNIPGLPVLRLGFVVARDWGAVQLVSVLDANFAAIPQVAVGRYWPDAPRLESYPDDCRATRWWDRAVIGWTNLEGHVGYGMGTGDCPPGASGVWPIHCGAPADGLEGLGWSPGDAHKTAWAVYLLSFEEEPPPPPPPEADAWLILCSLLRETGGMFVDAAAEIERLL